MLHRSPTLSILHDMLQPNGLADSHHSFDHRERLWCVPQQRRRLQAHAADPRVAISRVLFFGPT